MAPNQDLPATDSASALHELIGDDATATFESDPKFIDSDPTEDSSSENLQTRRDRKDVQEMPSIQMRDLKADNDDDDDEDEDVDDDDEIDEEDEDDDDGFDEDDDDEEDEDDDDEEEDEDDEDED